MFYFILFYLIAILLALKQLLHNLLQLLHCALPLWESCLRHWKKLAVKNIMCPLFPSPLHPPRKLGENGSILTNKRRKECPPLLWFTLPWGNASHTFLHIGWHLWICGICQLSSQTWHSAKRLIRQPQRRGQWALVYYSILYLFARNVKLRCSNE